jgi:hypothetical protein
MRTRRILTPRGKPISHSKLTRDCKSFLHLGESDKGSRNLNASMSHSGIVDLSINDFLLASGLDAGAAATVTERGASIIGEGPGETPVFAGQTEVGRGGETIGSGDLGRFFSGA